MCPVHIPSPKAITQLIRKSIYQCSPHEQYMTEGLSIINLPVIVNHTQSTGHLLSCCQMNSRTVKNIVSV